METAVDKWIDAIPDNAYDLCPCGCGRKWKFVLADEDVEAHEKRFIMQNQKMKGELDETV